MTCRNLGIFRNLVFEDIWGCLGLSFQWAIKLKLYLQNYLSITNNKISHLTAMDD